MRTLPALLFLLVTAPSVWGQALDKSKLREQPDLMPQERRMVQPVGVRAGTVMNATLTVTAKGNGTLRIANLRLRIFDDHNDGAIYKDQMPNVEFVDLDGDGCKDLIVVGAVEYYGEKGNSVTRVEPFTFVYLFDPKTNSFRLKYRHASFDLEHGPISD